MDEFNNLNSNNEKKEDVKSFDFDWSILDRVNAPVVDYEKQKSKDEEIVKKEEIKEEVANANPYEETFANTNPYVDYDNMEDVIGSEENNNEIEEATVYEEEDNTFLNNDEVSKEIPVIDLTTRYSDSSEDSNKVEENNEVVEEAPSTNSENVEQVDYSNKVDVDFQELEKVQKKQIKEEKTKNIRVVFVILMLLVIMTLIGTSHFRKDNGKPMVINGDDIVKPKKEEKKPETSDFGVRVDEALATFYDSKDNSLLVSVLMDAVNDEERMNTISSVTSNKIDSWINQLKNETAISYEDFVNKTSNIKTILNSMNEVEYEGNKFINGEKYQETIDNLNALEADGNDYYVAVSSYINKDYNNAYQLFEAIPSTNKFYDNSQRLLTIIINDIISLIQDDINNNFTNMEFLSEEEQQVKYKLIKSMIERYALAYPYVKLTESNDYQDLLKKYSDLIKE